MYPYMCSGKVDTPFVYIIIQIIAIVNTKSRLFPLSLLFHHRQRQNKYYLYSS